MKLRPHLKLSVADMTHLVSGEPPTVALIQSLLEELSHRDSAAATRLKERLERDLQARQQRDARGNNSRPGNGHTRSDEESKRRPEDGNGTARQHDETLLREHEALKAALKGAEARQAQLEAEVASLRIKASATADPLYARVYLTGNAPRWLVLDVQRAFRVKYHPDKYTGSDHRSAAERTFQEAEHVFSKILGSTRA